MMGGREWQAGREGGGQAGRQAGRARWLGGCVGRLAASLLPDTRDNFPIMEMSFVSRRAELFFFASN